MQITCSKIMGGSKKIGGRACSCSSSCSYASFTTHLVSEIFQKEALTMRNMNAKAFTKQLNGLPTPTKLRLANKLFVHKLFHIFTKFATFVSTWGEPTLTHCCAIASTQYGRVRLHNTSVEVTIF